MIGGEGRRGTHGASRAANKTRSRGRDRAAIGRCPEDDTTAGRARTSGIFIVDRETIQVVQDGGLYATHERTPSYVRTREGERRTPRARKMESLGKRRPAFSPHTCPRSFARVTPLRDPSSLHATLRYATAASNCNEEHDMIHNERQRRNDDCDE
ncbi:uncharacterized protein LOC107273461 [Cephus cinctus]|uniref:Uncharacterized protein LOC107273461 n=1 Tax=Cephus cinctus TaxID=211228 RepID=A0AAJ7W7E1_CEPCN|nr:uncharacterized protein LOC107273461 [Cephus cinctus]